jgi:hypothetical protein
MHPTVAAVASIGTRACLPSRYGTRRESTGAAVVIPQLWSLDHCRGLDGCWTQGREAQHSWQLVGTSEGDVEDAAPTMFVVVAQACFECNPDRIVTVDISAVMTTTLHYSNLIAQA